ncbi:MAG: NAD(P)-dependent oxidoreductase [Candidatus Omnitrophica bacterium]|nr:NAD(P)-dependent oxidoreductase [Candidatus Omnitrophota bacterium]
MTVLVAGGAGFFGRGLVRRLRAEGHEVRVLDRRESPEEQKDIAFFKTDVTDAAGVGEAVRGCSHIYNLVSLLPCSRAGKDFWRVNVHGTRVLLEAAQGEKGFQKFIHLSTSVVYGVPAEVPLKEESPTRPVGDYGRTKLEAERVCLAFQEKGMRLTILRPRFIIGPGRLGLLTILFEWVRTGHTIYTLGRGTNRFQMLGQDDLAEACVQAAAAGDQMIINLGADRLPSVREVLTALAAHAGTGCKVKAAPAAPTRLILRGLDKLGLSPLGTEHYLLADRDYVLDCSRAKKLLGWAPRQDPLREMQSAYDWYVEHRNEVGKMKGADRPGEKVLRLARLFRW